MTSTGQQSGRYLQRVADVATGVALISVDDHAENTIIVVSGANERVTLQPDEFARQLLGAHVLLLQLEIPFEEVTAAARIAHSSGIIVIVDPTLPANFPLNYVIRLP